LQNFQTWHSRSSLLALAVIIIAVSLAYINVLYGQFIWDDIYLVRDNAFIKNFHDVGKIFSGPLASGAGVMTNTYRPLQSLSYVFDYALSGVNTFQYHLTNIVLHILVSWLLFILMRALCRSFEVAFIAALIFSVHPVNTEAVSYIAGRGDLISGVFIYLTLISSINDNPGKKGALDILSGILYICALLSREYALVTPLLLLLCYRYRGLPIFTRRMLIIFIITACYVTLRMTALDFSQYLPAVRREGFSGWPARLPGAFAAIAHYARMLVFPQALHMEYGANLKIPGLEVLSGIAVSAAFSLIAFLAYKKRPVITFGILWFFIAIFPVSNIYRINAFMAEHWLYVPSAGLFMAVSYAAVNFAARSARRTIFSVTAAAIIFTALILATASQNIYWTNPVIFFERTLRLSPGNYRISVLLGNQYVKRGLYSEGERLYKEAIKLNPGDPGAYKGLGNLYMAIGEKEKALRSFERALYVSPEDAEI